MSGWKDWQVGEVVEAGEFQAFVQDQTVQNFDNPGARGSALGTAVAEGMVSYVKEQNADQTAGALEVYGNADWNNVVGTRRNFIMNGAAEDGTNGWTTSSTGSSISFLSTKFVSDLQIVPDEPVAGYFAASASSSAGTANFASFQYRIDDVRSISDSEIALTFFAGVDGSSPQPIAIEIERNYGSGGSSTEYVFVKKQDIASWGPGIGASVLTKYSMTAYLPSLVGKTIGVNSHLTVRFWLDAGSNFNARTGSLGQRTIFLAIGGIQLENSPIATPYEPKPLPTPVSHNYIINGAFDFWQRGTSFTSPGNQSYQADRWAYAYSSIPTTWSITQETFTLGDLEAIGFGEAQFYRRSTITTAGASGFLEHFQRVEDVRTLAGQTVTLSFYAKSNTTRSEDVYLGQRFGSGGSAGVNTTFQTINLTTLWQRFILTFDLASVSGKTIGAGSSVNAVFRQDKADGSTFDIWGVQLEAGSVATPFKRHAPSLQGELAACQRYYYRAVAESGNGTLGQGQAISTTSADINVVLPVTMRIIPTAIDQSGLRLDDAVSGFTTGSYALQTNLSTRNIAKVKLTGSSGLTLFRPYFLSSTSGAAFIGFLAEL